MLDTCVVGSIVVVHITTRCVLRLYTSAIQDANNWRVRALAVEELQMLVQVHPKFTRFTSTGVHILTRALVVEELQMLVQVYPKFTCFTSTKVHILTLTLGWQAVREATDMRPHLVLD